MIRFLLGAMIAGLLAAAAAVTLLWWSGGAAKAETVTVTEGATLTSLCPDLERRGLIPGTCTTYRLFARLLGSSDGIQAGEFEIPAGTSGAQLLDILQHGQPVQRLVTIPEGTPSILVAEKLASEIARLGGSLHTRAALVAVGREGGRLRLHTTAGDLVAERAVTACGLQADRVAKLFGVDPGVTIVP